MVTKFKDYGLVYLLGSIEPIYLNQEESADLLIKAWTSYKTPQSQKGMETYVYEPLNS